jgi:hypothetical protein
MKTRPDEISERDVRVSMMDIPLCTGCAQFWGPVIL